MTNLLGLLNELKENMHDISKDFADGSGYFNNFGDAFSEFADSYVDIYYSDRAKWFANHWELVNEANAELGSTGDVMQDIAQAQFLYYEKQLNGDIENIVLALATIYLIENGLEELNDLQLNNLNHITYQIDENSNLDDIADYCNENLLHKGGEE